MAYVVTFFRSLLFQLFLYTVLYGLVVIGMVWFLLFPVAYVRGFLSLWTKMTLFSTRVILGLKHEVSGLDNLPAEGALVASVHQSMWDVIFFPSVIKDCIYILKRELTWIPFYGWFLLRARMIAVGRRGGIAELVAAFKSRRRSGLRHFVIFPQGARRPYGERVRLLPGIGALYEASDLPVVPVVLDSGRYWRRRRFLIYSGTIRVHFLPPIEAGLPRQVMMRRLTTALSPQETPPQAS
ncbi:MAG: 1-acyl-sn-glycerol-3-phosphate acyltransferase [Alphaproteobacteria bacterium GM202ARS2]|nr:1-acyl-sn-glycerol-3-phosphate acyltransferase [Alphaproteobacteria bacterium GM202ARS2]